MKNIPELLSPVGGIGQLMAAVENGADAVYLGGEFFNARIKSENFDLENMSRAIAYAHIRNVKVYVTMNTLIYNDELENALEYAKQLYCMGADALILQDMGLVRLVRKYIPEMKIHLSTQGSVYNLSGVKTAKEIGFERVVLARETSLDEIKTICSANALEIEVFVHGALCMCYSGQCQLSRNMGGRSGNRGLCAQPCRLPYETEEGRAYPLSPKDISAVDYLGELAEAGVSSLKIEGRMKSPEYVAIVTGIYRKDLDIYAKEGTCKVSESDHDALTQIFSRGDFTEGYLFENPGDKLLSGDLPKHQGLLIGRVTKGNVGKGLIDIKLNAGRTLNMGDGIEIHNQELSGNVITYIEETASGDLRIGDLKGEIRNGDLVYKITDRALMEQARNTYKEDSWESLKSLKKIGVEMKFAAQLGFEPKLELYEKNQLNEIVYKVLAIGEVKAEKAVNRSLTPENVRIQLSKMGDTPFLVENIMIDMEDGISLPLSSLNKLRREATAKLTEAKSKGRDCMDLAGKYIFKETEKERARQNGNGNCINEDSEQKDTLELYFYSAKKLNKETVENVMKKVKECKFNFSRIRILIPIDDFYFSKEKMETLPENIVVVPYIANISKGKLDLFIHDHFKEIIVKCKELGIYIGNLGWIDEFKQAGIKVFGDFGLNINNIEAENWANELGLDAFVPSLESYDGIENENWLYEGAVPLMITEHPINMIFKENKRGTELRAIFLENPEKSIIVKNQSEIDYNRIRADLKNKKRNVRIFMPY